MSTINARMKEAIAAIKAGNKTTGRNILQSVLEDDPENEAALLWMTKVVDSPAEQLVYVERVLYVNPNNEPAQKLQAQLEKGSRLAEVARPPDRILDNPNFELISIPQPLVVKFPGRQTLTFSDGLNFGMGLLVASLLFVVCILPLGAGALVVVLQTLGFAIGQATR
jgi:hypothetical protein